MATWHSSQKSVERQQILSQTSTQAWSAQMSGQNPLTFISRYIARSTVRVIAMAPADDAPPDPALLNSVRYSENVSELKDDLMALMNIVKTGGKEGDMRRHAAIFLLWHHASDPTKRVEIIANGT